MTETSPSPSPTLDARPLLQHGVLEVHTPPALTPSEGLVQGLALNALPMVGSLGSVVFVATSGHGSAQSYLAAGMFLLASVGFVSANLWRSRSGTRGRTESTRRDYLSHLARVREQARSAASDQRRQRTWAHPAPTALAAVAQDATRVWEREPSSSDWLQVRYGRAEQPATLTLALSESGGTEPLDPICSDAADRLVAVHSRLADLPATLPLHEIGLIDVVGTPDDVRGCARAVITSATTFHPPGQLVVAVVTGPEPEALDRWDWVKWLPHAQSDRVADAVGPRRLVCSDLDTLTALLPVGLEDRSPFGGRVGPAPLPHLLLVLDTATTGDEHRLVAAAGLDGVTVMQLSRPPGAARPREQSVAAGRAPRWRLVLEPEAPGCESAGPASARAAATRTTTGVVVTRSEGRTTHGQADLLGTTGAEATARRLLRVHSRHVGASGTAGSRDGAVTTSPELTDLLHLGPVHSLDPPSAWARRAPRDLLRVPIGVGSAGDVVHLDLKESAQQGSGPHGLLIGATGSGKSELLRTLVLGLALTHSPDELNLVLVDFKGGATFAGLAGLPHVSALITNLADELTLVDRMQDALSGELTRRQELLRAAGGYASRRDYAQACERGEAVDLGPLPSLLVVCDEFSELLSARPEMVDLFVAIGRLGRSLGVHLLLASQRLDEGRLRGLDSHLSYRIALRTFSGAESRAVVGVPDAHELPATPGAGLLRDDPTRLTPFTAAYVSGAAPSAHGATVGATSDHGPPGDGPLTILPFVTADVGGGHGTPADEGRAAAGRSGPSTLDVAVETLSRHRRTAHRIWLPPLHASPSLHDLLPDLAVDATLGLVSPAARAAGPLRIPVGLVDRPREQRREVLWADLAGADGHVAVVGAPHSGRSTVLRTIVMGLTLTHTPREVSVYVLDFGGGAFEGLRRLPHVAGVATRSEADVVSRVVAEVGSVMAAREDYFREQGVDGIADYRTRRAAGELDDGRGDVVVVVDGWGTLRADFPDLELPLQGLAQRGLTYGVHLVTSATRWGDYRASLRDVLGTRVELRLGDPADSVVDRRLAAQVPAGRPGRGLTPGGHHFLAALPTLGGESGGGGDPSGPADLASAVDAAWTGSPAPRLRVLPTTVTLESVRGTHLDSPGVHSTRLLLGIRERDLEPVVLDLAQDPHLLVLGEARSGKSTVLRTYLSEVARLHAPATAQVFLVDYRRTHLGLLPDEWVADCATTAEQTAELARGLAAVLHDRLPGPDVTSAQLRARSWWQGREAFVVVDDYELVTGSQGNPLDPLVPLLARASDVGLHVVVARRSGGVSRVHDRLLTQLGDLAQPGLLLSGDPREGPILGPLRAEPAAPGRARLLTRDRLEVLQVALPGPHDELQ